jgi:hypothetical protein
MRYTAVVLAAESRSALLGRFRHELPKGWDAEAHHMTVNLGPADNGPAAGKVGQRVELRVVTIARGVRVVAVGVECSLPTTNARPHVTLAVDTAAGGRSRDANDLTGWTMVVPLLLQGTIREVD